MARKQSGKSTQWRLPYGIALYVQLLLFNYWLLLVVLFCSSSHFPSLFLLFSLQFADGSIIPGARPFITMYNCLSDALVAARYVYAFCIANKGFFWAKHPDPERLGNCPEYALMIQKTSTSTPKQVLLPGEKQTVYGRPCTCDRCNAASKERRSYLIEFKASLDNHVKEVHALRLQQHTLGTKHALARVDTHEQRQAGRQEAQAAEKSQAGAQELASVPGLTGGVDAGRAAAVAAEAITV